MESADPEKHAKKQLGRMLKDKWRLDALLGVGGSATVYAATHRNGNRVAVKMLHPLYSTQSADRERFLREGYLSNSVDHPDAVRVLDDNVDEDGTVFLVMELLEGTPVVSRWEAAGRRLPPEEVLWIADRLLAVLEVAHAGEIIHRDIKPDNLFLTSEGRLKVLDFGIARFGDVGTGTTLRGFILGTPGFAAPEQARGDWDAVDARADLWSVGATIFTLVSGKVVHHQPTPRSHLLQTSVAPAPPVHDIDATVPEPVADLIDRALSFLPEDRFQNAAEMRQAVRSGYRLVTGESLPEDLPRLSVEMPGAQPVMTAVTLGSPPLPPMRERFRMGMLAASAIGAAVATAAIIGYLVAAKTPGAAMKVGAQPSVPSPGEVLVSPALAERAPAAAAVDDDVPSMPVASAIVPAPSRSGVEVAAGAAGSAASTTLLRRATGTPASKPPDTGRSPSVSTMSSPEAPAAAPRRPSSEQPPVAKPAATNRHRLDFVDNRH